MIFRRRKLPALLSSEGAECGLTCLAMIVSYYGQEISTETLRSRFPISMNGMSLKNIIHMADALGMSTRAVKLDVPYLKDMQTPAILHWDLSHFVVLRSANSRYVEIHDPSIGYQRLTYEAAAQHFTGIALELEPTSNFVKFDPEQEMKISSLFSSIRGVESPVIQIIANSIGLQALVLASPFLIQHMMDSAIPLRGSGLLITLCLFFGFLILLHGVAKANREWTLEKLGASLNFQIMGNLIRHLLRLPAQYFEKRHVGDIISRLQSTKSLQDALTRGVLSTMIDGMMAITAIAIMYYYSIVLATVALLAFTFNLCVVVTTYQPLRSRNIEYLISEAKEKSFLIESIRASTTIKLMGAEAEREGSWRNLFGKEINASLSMAKFRIWIDLTIFYVNNLTGVIIIGLGSMRVINDSSFSIGVLITIIWYRQMFSDRSIALLEEVQNIRLIKLHLERIRDIIMTDQEFAQAGDEPKQLGRSIRLENVTFRYGECDRNILENLSISIGEGEFVAVMGPSGGGKSTLLKLLLGLHVPNSGRILIGDDVADPSVLRAWRKGIGVLSQDDHLMSGFVYENISFFDPEVDFNRVERAAKAAQLHDAVMDMPMRYFSLVGDMGSALSGGQRQRLLLARALYRDPKVLIVDEGTANLDEKTEDAIGDLLKALPITRIIVTHRLSLAEKADRIINIGEAFNTSKALSA